MAPAVSVSEVSVLFSEPKIPQPTYRSQSPARNTFQCSSASRKFLNPSYPARNRLRRAVSVLFSEPKIPQLTAPPSLRPAPRRFQCSSASRKFLNRSRTPDNSRRSTGFSALQRAENSSTAVGVADRNPLVRVSVLFSEPKIPQPARRTAPRARRRRFSALQRAENSSTSAHHDARRAVAEFQCSSASRKFLNRAIVVHVHPRYGVSVLFSEPKIPQPGGLR